MMHRRELVDALTVQQSKLVEEGSELDLQSTAPSGKGSAANEVLGLKPGSVVHGDDETTDSGTTGNNFHAHSILHSYCVYSIIIVIPTKHSLHAMPATDTSIEEEKPSRNVLQIMSCCLSCRGATVVEEKVPIHRVSSS